MHTRDYEAIGSVLAGEFAICNDKVAKRSIWRVTLSIADKFAQDNDRFDREKFYTYVFGTKDHFAVRDSIA